MAIKKQIDESIQVSPNAEVTVEVNPISFNLEKARIYHEGGVNRVSFGAQSFNNRILTTIGRPHSAGDVEKTLAAIHEIGWDNFSFDLIYGVPGQSLDDLADDLKRAIDAGPPHLSCFRLEVIPYTALKLRESAGLLPERCPRTLLDEMDELIIATLGAAGYNNYGAFDFAKPGYEGVHNQIAFMAPQGEYIGFGNSAYSFIDRSVCCNYAPIQEYEDAVFEGRDPIALAGHVSTRELMSRFFVLGLKFHKVARAAFREAFGVDAEAVFADTLCKLYAMGVLERTDTHYVLTREGIKYTNNVCKEFYTPENNGVQQWLQFVPNLTRKQVDYYDRIAQQNGRNVWSLGMVSQ
jgi:oxygen-independent coproporphyrinogen-3 oxidase